MPHYHALPAVETPSVTPQSSALHEVRMPSVNSRADVGKALEALILSDEVGAI